MSASAYLRGNGHAIFFARDYLAHLEGIGTRVINGSRAYAFEISKAAQLSLLHSLGIAFRVPCDQSHPQSHRGAREIGFPLIINRTSAVVAQESFGSILRRN